MIVPGKRNISFKDYSSITVNAETINKPVFTKDQEIESCGFNFRLSASS